VEVVKIIPKNDYAALENIVAEYMPGVEHTKYICNNFPTTVIGYYLDSKLIGYAYGLAHPEADGKTFTLDGIAIIEPHNATGRGGKLLAFFEKCVYELGFRRIDVGSAGGYVERFYLKNGYKAMELKILVEGDAWKVKQTNAPFPVAEVQTQGNYTKLVIAVTDYYAMDKEEITLYYGGVESFFVFEKTLEGEGRIGKYDKSNGS